MKKNKIFDPNAAAKKNSGIFGLPFNIKDAKCILIPVPWEATTSYGGCTSGGPRAVLKASHQVDLYDLELKDFYKSGIYMLKESPLIEKWNIVAQREAKKVIRSSAHLKQPSLKKALNKVNKHSNKLNSWVYTETRHYLDSEKVVGIIGGDHSVPLGAIKAVSEKFSSFGILHFDAHLDTRKAFEGFTYSHASIFYNVLTQIPQVTKLVQVGIRDFCAEELNFCRSLGERANIFFDLELQKKKFEGITWKEITKDIILHLPPCIWISFDIDCLDPRLCPNTGTPVPGGLDFNEAIYLISELVRAGKQIIGFDLCEVAPGKNSEWDANVGARLLFKLCGYSLLSAARQR
ncbi:MAG: agmatinase family protein [Bdellovibrio sp.]|nr:agmatinase family protein [Bdellovibrio sp.]